MSSVEEQTLIEYAQLVDFSTTRALELYRLLNESNQQLNLKEIRVCLDIIKSASRLMLETYSP